MKKDRQVSRGKSVWMVLVNESRQVDEQVKAEQSRAVQCSDAGGKTGIVNVAFEEDARHVLKTMAEKRHVCGEKAVSWIKGKVEMSKAV